MANNTRIISIEIDPELSLEDICQICQISSDDVLELITYGAIEPIDYHHEQWIFNARHVRRIISIKSLQQDLEVNVPGAVLALDLMEQITALQAQLDLLKKLIS